MLRCLGLEAQAHSLVVHRPWRACEWGRRKTRWARLPQAISQVGGSCRRTSLVVHQGTYVRTHCNSPFLSFTGRLRTYVEPFRSTFSIQDKNIAGVLPPSGRRIRDPAMFSELSGEDRRRGGHRCGPPQTFGRGAPTRRSQM